MILVNRVDEGLRAAMQTNEKIVALFANKAAAANAPVELGAGTRVLELACEAKELVGIATGMGVYGLHPVININQEDLFTGAFLQLFNASAQFRYRSGGQYASPMTIIVKYSGPLTIESLLLQIPGLHVYAPSSPQDFGNLVEEVALLPDPTVILIPEIWPEYSDSVRANWEMRIGAKQAKVLHEGNAITLVSYGKLTHMALEAAQILAAEGKAIELIDLRSLSPFDRNTILTSVKKTGRLVLLQDSPKSFGVGAEIAAYIGETAMDSMLAPIQRVAAFDAPDPGALSYVMHPDQERLLATLRNLADF